MHYALQGGRRRSQNMLYLCSAIRIYKNMKVYVLTMTSQLGLFAISEGRTKLACVMLSGAKNLTEGKKERPAE